MATKWPPIVKHAAEIAGSYSTPVTLRQLFYRLVSEGLLPNTDVSYKTLSARTAGPRRAGVFPALLDQGREITRRRTHEHPADALENLASNYRRDRTDGQEHAVWLVLEKKTLVEQVFDWVDEYGIPVVAIGGFGSVPIEQDVLRSVRSDSRPAVALYLGDLDPSGECIEETFLRNTNCFDQVRRLAVNDEQINEYGLVPAAGKATDSRAPRFEAKHGALFQVEVEAIDPAHLEQLVRDAVNTFIDFDQLERVLAVEEHERGLLSAAAAGLRRAAP